MYGAQDFWVNGRDSGATLLRAMRYAIERKPRLERLAHQANDDLLTGRIAGDNVLRRIAKRLTGVVRESDTVARVGGR